MSDLDLSAAVEAAARAAYSARYDAPPEDWDEMSEFYRRGWIDEARVAITAAAPHIRASELERYAAGRYEAYLEHPELDVLDQPSDMAKRYRSAADDLRAEAARIRGGTS